MQSVVFREWQIEVHPTNGEWVNITCTRQIEKKTHVLVRTKKKGFATVKRGISKYVLGWNGHRFAESTYYETIQKRHKLLFEFIKQNFCK